MGKLAFVLVVSVAALAGGCRAIQYEPTETDPSHFDFKKELGDFLLGLIFCGDDEDDAQDSKTFKPLEKMPEPGETGWIESSNGARPAASDG